jgi:hypothetical protein
MSTPSLPPGYQEIQQNANNGGLPNGYQEVPASGPSASQGPPNPNGVSQVGSGTGISPTASQVSGNSTPPTDWELLKQGLSKLPRSMVDLYSSHENDIIAPNKKSNEGYTEGPSLHNLIKNVLDSLSSTGSSVANKFVHPLESFAADPAGTLATLGGGALALKEGGVAVADTPVPSVVKGAAKGAFEGATKFPEGTKPGVGIVQRTIQKIPGAPTILGGMAGEYAGRMLGGEGGAEIGKAIGLSAPAISGAIRGGKLGLQQFREAQAASEQAAHDAFIKSLTDQFIK